MRMRISTKGRKMGNDDMSIWDILRLCRTELVRKTMGRTAKDPRRQPRAAAFSNAGSATH